MNDAVREHGMLSKVVMNDAIRELNDDYKLELDTS